MDTPQNRSKIVLRTMKNMIGEYSNYSSAYHNKTPRTQEQKNKYSSYIDIISVATGKSIDFAKTGVLYHVPRNIAKFGRPLPYFMKYRGEYYAKQQLSKSSSNMNRLCYALEKWDKGIRFQRSRSDFDYSLMIDDSLEYTEDMYNAVKEVYIEYYNETKSNSKFLAMCRDYDRYREELESQIDRETARHFDIDWGVYYEKYKRKCLAVCQDQRVLANIAVRICYEEYSTRDKRFIWIVAEDGVVENIKQIKHRLPVRVYDGIGDMYLGKYYEWAEYEGDFV